MSEIQDNQSNAFFQAYQRKLLEVFERTVNFLNERGIKWCAAYGTCLGA